MYVQFKDYLQGKRPEIYSRIEMQDQSDSFGVHSGGMRGDL